MKTIPINQIPAGWYQLKDGTTIIKGDEVWLGSCGTAYDFSPATYIGNKVWDCYSTECAYIRKISNNQVVEFHTTNLAKTTAVLTYLKGLGFTYAVNHTGVASKAQYDISQYPLVEINITKKTISGNLTARYPAITFDKVFEINTFIPVEVKLNDEYTAVIQQDGSVKVGCQTFPANTVLLLAEKVKQKLTCSK